jgi:hypothetical protein
MGVNLPEDCWLLVKYYLMDIIRHSLHKRKMKLIIRDVITGVRNDMIEEGEMVYLYQKEPSMQWQTHFCKNCGNYTHTENVTPINAYCFCLPPPLLRVEYLN